MKVLYIRTSTIEQNSERQKQNKDETCKIIEDKCSGAIPFFERDGGKKILELTEKRVVDEIIVHEIDRLGRNLLDILKTIAFFNTKKVNIEFKKQGLRTLNEDGSENDISKMVISILGVVAEMERKMIRERQLEGIAIAKANGVYKGRKKDTTEDPIRFLNKEKNKKAVVLLNKGYKNIQIAKIVGLHPNTVTRIKRLNQKINSYEV
ncbi:recombinase family protein [Flavobacteriaceae bacterium]|nr:recombinase family protein [Flavobacteriaceae bacterium]MDB4183075.1 recombinase family protein [Flavobacteriaceae bacterium]